MDDRDLLPPDQSIDLLFHEFMADDLATVERIYELADQPFTEASRSAMETFRAGHPRGRHGAIIYQPEVLGIDPAERRRSLAFYASRFGVEDEG